MERTLYLFLRPAGNIVEFIARHNLVSDSDGDFKSADILNISEIGLAVCITISLQNNKIR
jgi:hypothetical protein